MAYAGPRPREPLWTKFRRKAFTIPNENDVGNKALSGHEMHKCLSAFDLVMLGIGEVQAQCGSTADSSRLSHRILSFLTAEQHGVRGNKNPGGPAGNLQVGSVQVGSVQVGRMKVRGGLMQGTTRLKPDSPQAHLHVHVLLACRMHHRRWHHGAHGSGSKGLCWVSGLGATGRSP